MASNIDRRMERLERLIMHLSDHRDDPEFAVAFIIRKGMWRRYSVRQLEDYLAKVKRTGVFPPRF